VNTNQGWGPRVRSVTTSARCSGVWAGHVEYPGVHVAERENVAILHRAERKPGLGGGVQDVLGTRRRGQLTAGREMVGVHVRVDDVAQPEPHGSGRFEVAIGLAHGINDRTNGMTAAAGPRRV
jgi:hypothetical protein